MKKFLMFFAVFIILILLSGCGEDTVNNNPVVSELEYLYRQDGLVDSIYNVTGVGYMYRRHYFTFPYVYSDSVRLQVTINAMDSAFYFPFEWEEIHEKYIDVRHSVWGRLDIDTVIAVPDGMVSSSHITLYANYKDNWISIRDIKISKVN